jgi:hypothetical protein
MARKKTQRRKGQSFLFSHSILVGFGVILIFIVIVAFTNLRSDFQGFTARNELQQACMIVQGGIEKINVPSGYRPQGDGMYGEINVKLPDRIAGLPYNIRFADGAIIIEAGDFAYTCRAGFSARYAGASSGGITRLAIFRNSTADRIEMGSI